jgi:hypothetical protein
MSADALKISAPIESTYFDINLNSDLMTLNYHNHQYHIGLFWFNKTANGASNYAAHRTTSGGL